jgi:hypothetical protein
MDQTGLCEPGEVSKTGRKPCVLCKPGTHQPKYNGTSCIPCPLGTYISISGAPMCMSCAPGKGTFQNGTISVDACFGIGLKDLINDACELNSRLYVKDDGGFDSFDILRGGSGYIPGIVNISGTRGKGLVARFTTMPLEGGPVVGVDVGTGANAGGRGYTSQGVVRLNYVLGDMDSRKEMGGTVSRISVRPFVSLKDTPETYMEGCNGGVIMEESSSDRGLLALYRGLGTLSAENGKRMTDVCFGSYTMNPSTNQYQCVERIDQHGSAILEKPTLVVRETRITGIRVRPGAFVTCPGRTVSPDFFVNRTCVPLIAEATRTSGFFDACFTPDLDINDVRSRPPSLTFNLKNGGFGWTSPPRVWPATPECRCGTGLWSFYMDEVTGRGSGYPPLYGGPLIVVSAPTNASGFVGTFETDELGRSVIMLCGIECMCVTGLGKCVSVCM